MAETDETELRLWLFNQYALRIDQPGITRNATLAKYMAEHGVRTTIFASPTHYWNVTGGTEEKPDPRLPEFHYTKTEPVEHNGIRRVLSMLSFTLRSTAPLLVAPPKGEPRPDVVLGSSPHLFSALGGWLVAQRYRAPFVLEVRDLWPDSLVQLLGLSRRHPLVLVLAAVERFLYRRAAFVVTLLPGSEEHIRRAAGRQVEILLLANGTDLERIPAYVDRERGADEDFVIRYAGAHGIPNSLDTLMEAALELQTRGESGFSFVLIGDGKEKGNLQQFATEHGLTNVAFLDAMPKAELLAVLPDSDVLAIPIRDSPLYEGGISPNKLFDYFGAGRPVIIATNTPLNPVVAADAGVVTPPEDPRAFADALIRLRSLPTAQLQAMGRRGRDFVEASNNMSHSGATLARALRSTVERARGSIRSRSERVAP